MNILLQLYAQIVTNKIKNKKTYAFAFSFFVFFGVFVDLYQRHKNVPDLNNFPWLSAIC